MMRRLALLTTAAFLLVGAGQGTTPPPRHTYLIPDTRRVVQGWHVTNLAEEDGGRLVRMTRNVGRIVLIYQISYWRGNYGPYAHASVDLPNGNGCASDDWQRDSGSRDMWSPETHLPARSRAIRAVFTSGLSECHIAPARIAAALRGFDAAFALTSRWAELSRRSTLAESAWISSH
jgi:hypothetical protein